jgi:ATP/maltotriose-dependent transcriptional regulator MalT/DNA-binding SARP family transcriptional activator
MSQKTEPEGHMHLMANTPLRIKNRFQQPSLARVFHRTSLHSLLEKNFDHKLFIIQGKAGQGKSTLIADFLSQNGIPTLWYRADRDDADPSLLLDHLHHGLTTISPRSNTYYHENQTLPSSLDIDEKLNGFLDTINQSLFKGLSIVIDNYNVIDHSEEARECVKLIAENLPSHLHLFLLTSCYPSFCLSRVRSDKELAELFDKDLNLTLEEMVEIIENVYELSFKKRLLERLYSVIDGWITGLTYLLEQISFKPEKEQEAAIKTFLIKKHLTSLDDFFDENVFSTLAQHQQNILCKIGILPVITPEIFCMVTEESDTSLLAIENRNTIFLKPVKLEENELTFHPLFAKYLEKKFAQLSQEEQTRIHTQAAYYFESQEQYDLAIMQWSAAKEHEKAKQTLIPYADELLQEGKYDKIYALLKHFSYTEKSEDPYLAYFYGIVSNLIKPFSSRQKLFSLLATFREKKEYTREAKIYTELLTNYFFYLESDTKMEELLTMAETFVNTVGDTLVQDKKEVLNALINLGKWWIYPENKEAFEIALRAEETSFRFQDEEAFLCSRLTLGWIYIDRGEFLNAKELLLKTEKIFEREQTHHPYKAFISFLLGDTYFYLGELDLAIKQMEKTLEKLPEGFAFKHFLELNVVTYYLYSYKVDQGEAYFDSIREKDFYQNMYMQYFWVYLIQMLLAYRTNNRPRMEYYCKRLMEKENQPLLKMDYPFSYLALSEVNLILGNYEDAERFLGETLAESEKRNFPYPAATAYALLGLKYDKQGRKKEAKENFSNMLQILEENNFGNLDICDPDLIREIAKITGSTLFHHFPRLAQPNELPSSEPQPGQYVLEFKTFGQFQIFFKGKETPIITLSRQKRVIDLLKLLIVFRKNGISKEIVYATFWPRYSYKSARDNLNTVVYRLRKILGVDENYISTQTNTIKLKEGTYKTDVDDFLALLEMGQKMESNENIEKALEFYKKAAAIYKGDFLESGLYLDIIRDERENLRNRFKHLLFKMVKLSLGSGNYRESLEWAGRIVSIDPLCEPAYRLLMIASVLIGNRTEITRIFNKLTSKLETDLGITPDEKTERLKDSLLGGKIPEKSLWENETIL